MATRWKEIPQYNYGDGIYRITSNTDPKFPASALFKGNNIVYSKDSNDPEAMYGSTQLGATAMGGTVSGLYDYNNGDKLIATAEDGKVYEYGADWAAASGARATGNTTTANVRWSGEMFYGATTAKNLLILTNGVDRPIQYNTTDGAVVLAGSPPATGDFPIAFGGRLWLFSGDTAFYSAVDDCEDWSTAGGGGSLSIYRGQDGDITGAAVFADSLFIFKRSSIYRIPTGSISNLSVKMINSSIGCVAHNTIQEVGGSDLNILCWWSEHGIEGISPSDVGLDFVTHDVARWIQPILDNKNTTGMGTAWALYNTPRMEYFSAFPSGTGAVPKEQVIGNFARTQKRPRWTRADRINLTAGVTFNTNNTDYDQYVGTTTGKVLKMHDKTVEDWDGVPFTKQLQTAYDTQKAPNRMKVFGWSYVRAVGSSGGAVTVRQRILRQGLNALALQNNTTLTAVADGWGLGEWGVATWGGSGTSGPRIRPVGARRGFGMSHVITTTNYFTLSGITIGSVLRSNKSA